MPWYSVTVETEPYPGVETLSLVDVVLSGVVGDLGADVELQQFLLLRHVELEELLVPEGVYRLVLQVLHPETHSGTSAGSIQH